MSVENRERIETGRRTIEIKDQNGDIGKEERIEYQDGSWIGRGEITEGPSVGHRWVKGEGGAFSEIKGSDRHEFFTEQWTHDMKPGRWGVIIDQGENPKKPEKGANWLHATTHLTRDLPRIHPDADLVERPDAIQVDERTWVVNKNDSELYRLTRNPNGEVMVTLTEYGRQFRSPKSAEMVTSYIHRTNRMLEGPRAGHTWEEREMLDGVPPEASGYDFSTSEGVIRELHLNKWSRDLDTPEQAGTLYLQLNGEWVPAQAPESEA